MTHWDELYKKSYDDIPWNTAQADFLMELLQSGLLHGRSALDLGCGIGRQSEILAKNGFEQVIGVDVSEEAIKMAEKNAVDSILDSTCSFVCSDALDWLKKSDCEFDCILDWALLHCLPRSHAGMYARLVQKHLASEGLLLVRVFDNEKGIRTARKLINGIEVQIQCYSSHEIEEIFGELHIIKEATSVSSNMDQGFYFNELLMKKGI
jgi:2-polyprenyl-3-methyl-5-hydroxy-6-metoxy-1,4-benzoquinol methylase